MAALAGCAGHPAAGGTGPAGHLGLPRYYAVYRAMPEGAGPDPGGDVIEIRDTATGRIHDRFDLTRSLGGRPGFRYWSDNALTAAGQRTFFASYARSASDWRVYRFSVTGVGRITGFTHVYTAPGGNGAPTAMAVSPDGTRLAIAPNPWNRSSEIVVANLATGAQTVWQGGLRPLQSDLEIAQLSWGSDGHTLAFLYWGLQDKGTFQAFPHIRSEIRTLDTNQPGGSLASSRLIVNQFPTRTGQGVIEQAATSPDGNTVTAAALVGPVSPQTGLPGDVQVAQYSAADGHQVRVLYQGATGNSTSPCLRGDGNGHWLLTANWKLGWIGGGRLHDLPPGQDGTVTDVAW